jgi:hypothetical protein
MSGIYSTYVEEGCVYRVSVGKPEGNRPLGRPRRRWENNIKMDLQKWDVKVWTGSSWFRIGTGGGTCYCGIESSGSIKCGEFDYLNTC